MASAEKKPKKDIRQASLDIKEKVKKKNKKKLIIIIICVVIGIYFAYTLISQQISLSKKNNEIENLQSQINSANEETKKLQTELDNFNNPEYIERIAREKLGLVRPNERVFIDQNKSEDNSGKN